ncbi:MAG TPA: transglutaminase-like domain-containing protein [Limnochordales bacterium]
MQRRDSRFQQQDPQLAYYVAHGPITEPGEWGPALRSLPQDMRALCRAVQGSLIHVYWGKAYGQSFTDERKADLQLRHVADILRRLAETGGTSDPPLTTVRPPGQRLVCNCRHFSTLLVAILREQGVPARVRVGFGRYFDPGAYEDHWVCEYWDATDARWVLVDPQLDPVQCEALGVGFDPCDVPRDQFLSAGDVWHRCRSGSIDPDRCGILDLRGLWFVRGNVVRDLAALNKVELLPWDAWGLIEGHDDSLSEDNVALLDMVADLTAQASDVREPRVAETVFERLRMIYETDERLRVPRVIRSYGAGGPHLVDLGPGLASARNGSP